MPISNPSRCTQPQGASLPTVIMVVALMITLAFTVVAIAFNHLNLSFRSSNNAKAEHLAEATLAVALEKARLQVEEFGLTGTAANKTVIVTLDSLPEGSRGVLTFDQDTAAALGVPYSTNNRSENAVPGSNPRQPVPGQSLHLVARAEVRGAFSTMEAVITVPKFPFSIASGGAIRSNGGLLVAAVRPDVMYDLSLPIHKDDLQPGHLVTNSVEGDNALVLSGTNTIMGDVQSASGATIESDTLVYGETRLNADAVKLPDLDAYDYEPDASDNPLPVETASVGTLNVKGFNQFREYPHSGHLTVDNGINLQGGVLYVNGDLTVSSGGVRGKGAIIATGNITINGGGEATTDNQAALVANGNITLRGTPSEKAKFAGLIYTKGNLTSENLRLAGVFVAGGTNSQVTLENTELYQVEELAKLELSNETVFDFPNMVPNTLSLGSHPVEASYDFDALRSNLGNFVNPNTGPGEPQYLFKFKVGDSFKRYTYNDSGPVMVDTTVDTTGPDQYVLDGADLGLKIFGETVTDQNHAESVIISRFEQIYAAEGKTLTATERAQLRNYAQILFTATQAGFGFSQHAAVRAFEASMNPGGGTATAGAFKWSLDLSEFFGDAKPMRVVSWGRLR